MVQISASFQIVMSSIAVGMELSRYDGASSSASVALAGVVFTMEIQSLAHLVASSVGICLVMLAAPTPFRPGMIAVGVGLMLLIPMVL
jgi:hypothetical protein